MDIPKHYIDKVKSRNRYSYFKGLIARGILYIKYRFAIYVARRNGAKVGDSVAISIGFARRCNRFVSIGDHTSINTKYVTKIIAPLNIGSNVIINEDVKIIMGSHKLDSENFEVFKPNEGLTIGDYVWLCPGACITAGVKNIGAGAVVGTCSVVYADLKPMDIAMGNPARTLSHREVLHTNVLAEELVGGDFRSYVKARNM